MTTFSLVALGILLGLLFAATIACVAIICYVSYKSRAETAAAVTALLKMQARANLAASDLRRDVTAALAAIDANRLHDASMAIQIGAKRIDGAVSALNKVIFAAGMADAGMGLTTETLDEMSDQRRPEMLEYDTPQKVQGRWAASSFAPPPAGGQFTPAADDPFAAWRARQQEKADDISGASFPAAPAGPLPDLEAGFAEDLADESIMSDHDIASVPGITDSPLAE